MTTTYRNWLTCFGYAIKSVKVLKNLSLLLWLLPGFVTAQSNLNPKNLPLGKFLSDTIKVGQPVQLSFFYRHSSTEEVIFPDSTFDFSPFEYINHTYFPTRTRAGQSLDSVIYTLRTFKIDPTQSISLPAFVLRRMDTLKINSLPIQVNLLQLVPGSANIADLKAQTQLAPIPERFNFAYWLIGTGILALLLVFIWMLFGKRIIIRYRLYILRNTHHSFINKFNAYIDKFNQSESLQIVEQAIILWKNYLTNLEGNAINSFTTKEIAAYYNDDEDVTTALRLFDKAIYGNIVSDKSSETIIAFFLLHHFADRRYEFVKERTKNAAISENLVQLA